MRAAIPILFLSALLGATRAQACVDGAFVPVVELRASQPLMASPDGDDDYLTAIDAHGCVKLHFPSFDTRRGTYAFRLDATEFSRLQRELAASGVLRFDPSEVRRDLRARELAKSTDTGTIGYYVRDEEILAFVLTDRAIGGKGEVRTQFVWTGLREQLLNHPDQPSLIGIAAVRDRLNQLAGDTRMKRVPR